MQKEKIQVLLATFNGEEYLEELLISIISQVNIEIHLTVSDDGSTDGTFFILAKYSKHFASYELFKGPRKGASANFLFLLTKVKHKYIAFADQDDVWLNSKLEFAVGQIGRRRIPTLYVGSVLVGKRLLHSKPHPMPISLTRNRSQGCAMVFNNEFAKILLKLDPRLVVMHDWASVCVAQIYGSIYWDSNPCMRYRIHQNNTIGLGSVKLRIKKGIHSLVRKSTRTNILSQARAISQLDSDILIDDNYKLLNEWIAFSNKNLISRISYVFENRRIFMSDFWSIWSGVIYIRGAFIESKF
jgi:glycosyltransferase involved in cell wall biosynthesis